MTAWQVGNPNQALLARAALSRELHDREGFFMIDAAREWPVDLADMR